MLRKGGSWRSPSDPGKRLAVSRYDASQGGWVARLALGIVLLYVAFLAFRVLRILSPWVALSAGLACTLVGLYHLFGVARLALKYATRDPYSLDVLKEVDEKLRNQPEHVHPDEMEGVYCPSCDEVYVDDVRFCPRCGRSL
jgi:hypothetical protein